MTDDPRLPTKKQLQRTVNRLYALSVALLRAETLYEKYFEEATKLFAAGKTDDELVVDLAKRIAGLQNDGLIRAGSLLSLHLGVLYSIVEAWRDKWKFKDETVDALLQSPFVKKLERFRNSIFHVSVGTDPDIMQWGADMAAVAWGKQLSAALRAAILDYHNNLAGRVTVQLVKPKQ
jgi:hypothetical protein